MLCSSFSEQGGDLTQFKGGLSCCLTNEKPRPRLLTVDFFRVELILWRYLFLFCRILGQHGWAKTLPDPVVAPRIIATLCLLPVVIPSKLEEGVALGIYQQQRFRQLWMRGP